uniref:Uncharacterized protein n=1 Tax=Arundo donax TaxID=35708 RepID=A0A0A9BNF3_ARUDO
MQIPENTGTAPSHPYSFRHSIEIPRKSQRCHLN